MCRRSTRQQRHTFLRLTTRDPSQLFAMVRNSRRPIPARHRELNRVKRATGEHARKPLLSNQPVFECVTNTLSWYVSGCGTAGCPVRSPMDASSNSATVANDENDGTVRLLSICKIDPINSPVASATAWIVGDVAHGYVRQVDQSSGDLRCR